MFPNASSSIIFLIVESTLNVIGAGTILNIKQLKLLSYLLVI